MSLDDLRLLTPWPEQKPPINPNAFGWCEQAQIDVFMHYLKNCKVYLEVGTFLGKSARLALECLPKDAVVICIDPWWDNVLPDQYDPREPIPEVPPSQWDVFCVNMWEFRDRVIPIKGLSQIKLFDVYNLGVQPDFVYLDGWHTFEQVVTDLEMVYRFFPNAKIFGDDWDFKLNNSNVAGGVGYWNDQRGFSAQVHKNRVFRIIK